MCIYDLLNFILPGTTRLPATSLIYEILGSPFSPNPFGSLGHRIFRFCIPDEWYRRTNSRIAPTAGSELSEATLRRLAALQESDEEDEDEGTTKLDGKAESHLRHPTATQTMEQRGLVTQGRLSSMFEGWLRPTSPTTARHSTVFISDNKKSVSEPRLVESLTENMHEGNQTTASADEGDLDDFDAAFELMLVGIYFARHFGIYLISVPLQDEFGLKGEKRSAMHALTRDRKAYLLRQNRQFRSSSQSSDAEATLHANHPPHSVTYGPSSAANLLPRLIPQLTGDPNLPRRFSIFGWGVPSGAPTAASAATSGFSGELNTTGRGSPGRGKSQTIEFVEEAQPIQVQTTGGLWSSWWTSSGGEKTTSGEKSGKKESGNSAKWYIDALCIGKPPDMKLVKHLISLRVHLSTAKLAFIEDFVCNQKGLEAIGMLLAGLVGKGGKRKQLNEVETTALLELIKCLRVLLNTEVSSMIKLIKVGCDVQHLTAWF